jgi:hypothetical protein
MPPVACDARRINTNGKGQCQEHACGAPRGAGNSRLGGGARGLVCRRWEEAREGALLPSTRTTPLNQTGTKDTNAAWQLRVGGLVGWGGRPVQPAASRRCQSLVIPPLSPPEVVLKYPPGPPPAGPAVPHPWKPCRPCSCAAPSRRHCMCAPMEHFTYRFGVAGIERS